MSNKPHDFEAYWDGVLAELAALPMAAELTELPIRSNEHGKVYGLKLTSIGPYRIFAYYGVPHGAGPFPAVVQMPRYGSVNHVPSYESRQRFAVLQLCHRGQRLSDVPYTAAYPGLLTDGIDDPASYIYRGIVADCVRALEFVQSRAEVKPGYLTVTGNELGLIATALRGNVDHLVMTPDLFYRASEIAPTTSGYPLEEYNDYTRFAADKAGAAWNTVSYFEPLHFAPRVKANTLLVTGNERDLFTPALCAPLAEALGGPVEHRIATHSLYQDGAFEATWVGQQHGFETPVLPDHWVP